MWSELLLQKSLDTAPAIQRRKGVGGGCFRRYSAIWQALLMEYSGCLSDTSSGDCLWVWWRGLKVKGYTLQLQKVFILICGIVLLPFDQLLLVRFPPVCVTWIVSEPLMQRNANERPQHVSVIRVTCWDWSRCSYMTNNLPVCLSAWQMDDHDESGPCVVK